MKTLRIVGCVLLLAQALVLSNLEAATWIVDDPADPAPVTGTLTLRQAIGNANSDSLSDLTVFAIPFPGVQTISLTAPFPAVVEDSLTIDGYTQPGASPGPNPPSTATIMIEIDGSGAGVAHGLWIKSSSNTIQGLAINNFYSDGVRIEGRPQHTYDNLILGNFIGTDATGTFARGNGYNQPDLWAGVDILSTGGINDLCYANRVENNLISGNFCYGVRIMGYSPGGAYWNDVSWNYIGTDVTGTVRLGNQNAGVMLAQGALDNTVYENVISDNLHGVDIVGNSLANPPAVSSYNFVTGNAIGVAADWLTPMGNAGYGVSIGATDTNVEGHACNNCIDVNVIANNGAAGIRICEHPSTSTNADSNVIDINSIYDNGGLGIDLGDDGVTVNDPDDLDTGANQEINYPIILTATDSCGTTIITGEVNPAVPGREIQVFRVSPDPTGHGEGDLFLGRSWTDGGGTWNITATGLVPWDSVTAVTIDAMMNSSEFSPGVPVEYPLQSIDLVADGDVDCPLSIAGPNPFSRDTFLNYTLRKSDRVSIKVYDVSGALASTLVDEVKGSGDHVAYWDGRHDCGQESASGIYFVRFKSGEHRSVCKLLKVR